MCINDTIYCDYGCLMSPARLHSVPIVHANARIGERINCAYEYTTDRTGSMSEDITSTLPFAGQPLTSATNESFESTEISLDIQRPPPRVIDYWFDHLGLSLDTTSSENPSSITRSPLQFPQFDGIIHVSGFYVVRPPLALRGFLIGFHQSASATPNVETSSLENPLVTSAEKTSAPLPSPENQVKHRRAQPHGVARQKPLIAHERKKSFRKVYDQPGRKPAAEYESDPIKLEALCQLRGGTEFACQWIPRVFKGGVTLEALLCRLKLTEIESMNFQGGFKPSLAYDGFLQMAEGGFECCLCAVGKRIWWRNKKDAVRHFRKFHFGLADECNTWYVMYYALMYLSRSSN